MIWMHTEYLGFVAACRERGGGAPPENERPEAYGGVKHLSRV